MRKALVVAITIFGAVFLSSTLSAQAQTSPTAADADSSGVEIVLVNGTPQEEQAKRHLESMLRQHDLTPWIARREVRIDETATSNQSRPVITLKTDLFTDENEDLALGSFVHEQMHWFVYDKYNDGQQAAIEDLKQMYPEAHPAADYTTYLHLIVAWLELDAVAEMLGEERARQSFRKDIQQFVTEPLSAEEVDYRWYNNRVLEDTEEIGAVLARHELVVTPEKGLVVDVSGE